MLNQVLREIEAARGPVSINDLCLKLGVERSALEGMIQFWVRKGRIQDEDAQTTPGACKCSPATAHNSACADPRNCLYVAKMPRTYTIPTQYNDK